MATYHGEFVNPVGSWRVASRPDDSKPEGCVFFIEVFRSEEREIDGVSGTFSFWSSHTSGHEFEDASDADCWMEAIEEKYEEDYDQYLDENRFEIAQMERYEMWRNEF